MIEIERLERAARSARGRSTIIDAGHDRPAHGTGCKATPAIQPEHTKSNLIYAR